MFKINFHRQTAIAAPAELETVREDFVIYDVEEKTVNELLNLLRDRTYNFVTENRLISGTTEFEYYDLPITVTLTDSYDFMYTVNRYKTSSFADAVAVIADAIQF